MEEPQRSIVAKNYEMIKAGWEEMLDRTRENLKAGSDPMDLIAAEGAFLLGTEEQSSENLAFTVAAIAVVEAQRSPRSRGARKAAVPAKAPRPTKALSRKDSVELTKARLKTSAEINAAALKKLRAKEDKGPLVQELQDALEAEEAGAREAEAQEAWEGKKTGPIEHGPHPLEGEDV